MSDHSAIIANPVKPDLAALAATIREQHSAATAAANGMLDHAIAAGEALAAAKRQVSHGEWGNWLRRCGINERVASRYMRIAAAQSQITANRTRASDLSIAAALRLINGRSSTGSKSRSPKQSEQVLSSLAWSNATLDQRRQFLDAIGIDSLFEALPPARRPEFQQRAAHTSLDDKMAKLLRLALASDGVTPEGVSALKAVKTMIIAAGHDLHEVVGLKFNRADTVAKRAKAA
jgi:hypothetical protein